jgi:hypothetical protein
MNVIDHKKVDLTSDEYALYQKIVKSYTTTTNKGEDYFQDLFEVNDDGIIIFLRPPSTKQTSFEIFMFLVSIFQQQHMRLLYKQVEGIAEEMKNKCKELDEKIALLNKK